MNLSEHLVHLWPNFSAISEGTAHGVAAIFWLAMTAGFLLSLLFVGLHYSRSLTRLKAVGSLLDGQTRETLAENRNGLLKRALGIGVGDVGSLWREFDESLVASADQTKLFNTLDAEHFFNGRTLARGLTASRLLAAAPSFLVAVGVLGTFVGLTMGLAGLQVESENVDELKQGISQMIQGASVAFLTSIWGVFYSLSLNFIEKLAERSALARIHALQLRIDFLYPRIPAEQSLVHIAEYTRASNLALQELHERIGDRLQETVEGMSEAMQQALSDTLNRIMGPAIESLVTNAGQQSTQVLEQLVTRFMEGISTAGRAHSEQLEGAAGSVNGAVESLTGQIDKLVTTLDAQQRMQSEKMSHQAERFSEQLTRIGSESEAREDALARRFADLMEQLSGKIGSQFDAAQQRDEAREESLRQLMGEASTGQSKLISQVSDATQKQLAAVSDGVLASQQQGSQMAEQHRALMGRLQEVADAVAVSSKHMDSSANQLGTLSAHLKQTADALGQRIEALAREVHAGAALNQKASEQMEAQVSALASLQQALQETAQATEETARLAGDGFRGMKVHQEEFLASVGREFSGLGSTLTQQVEELEGQAKSWLEAYAEEVRNQVQERMDTWNSTSLAYANEMQRAVQAISNIVDELEVRSATS